MTGSTTVATSTARALAALVRPHFTLTIPVVVPLTVYYARDGEMTGVWLSAWATAAASPPP